MGDQFLIRPPQVRAEGKDVPPEQIQAALNELSRQMTAALNTLVGEPEPPSGPAGGDLSGTYPNPTVSKVNGVIAGTMANQNANAVAITGGSIAGVTVATSSAIGVPSGGTGQNALSAHNVLIGEGTGGIGFAAPGAAGSILSSIGPAADPAFQSPAALSLARTTGTLAQFAATTSVQLAGVISDGTGTGALVFSNSPALAGTPTAPTAAAGTSTTQLATTAFVQGAAGVGRVLAIRVFTSSTTYTPTPGTTSVLWKVQGAGGGGGGCAASGNQGNVCGGGAGQAGDYAEHYMTSGFSGLPLTIGAGGTAGTSTVSGGPGGDTSVGTVCVAKGGLGGFTLTAASSSHFAAGPTGTRTAGTPGNLYNVSGQVPGFTWGIANAMSWSSSGGNSPLGTGGQWSHNDAGSGIITTPTPANPGRGYGSGAGGVDLIGVVSAINGAAGAQGVIIAVELS